ncbi:MAG: hemerythrin domain-containing protein [Pseudorhodoplanes sp.]|nr:hemerythrin domain-containing protein [Pseudorhodoplanes sp.]
MRLKHPGAALTWRSHQDHANLLQCSKSMLQCREGRPVAASFLTELGQVLHEEHFRILSLICGLENRVAGGEGGRPIDPANAEERANLQALTVALDQIIDHNRFEESILFPLIYAGGGGDLTALLTHEHDTIGPLARHVRSLATAILDHGVDGERWDAFQSAAKDLVSEMMSHLQKEEMAVVQRLRLFLDTETDHRLAERHLAERPPTRIKIAFQ